MKYYILENNFSINTTKNIYKYTSNFKDFTKSQINTLIKGGVVEGEGFFVSHSLSSLEKMIEHWLFVMKVTLSQDMEIFSQLTKKCERALIQIRGVRLNEFFFNE